MKRYMAYNKRTGQTVYLGSLSRPDLQPMFLRYKRELGWRIFQTQRSK